MINQRYNLRCSLRFLALGFLLALPMVGLSDDRVLYRVTPIGDLPGGPFSSDANAVNDLGQIGGTGVGADWYNHAVRWDPDRGMIDLGVLPGGRASIGEGINIHGHITGPSGSIDNRIEAFLWTPETGMIGLGDLPGGTFSSWGTDVNDRDQVVGRGSAVGFDEAFIWSAESGMRGLGFLPGGRTSSAHAVNNAGQVTGWSESARALGEGFIWDAQGGMRSLGDIPGGGIAVFTFDINELGQIAGSAGTPSGSQGFIWDERDGFTTVGTLPGPQPAFTRANGLNDRGQVVGWAVNGNNPNQIQTGFIWDARHGLRALAPLVEARTPAGYADVGSASDINNVGQITARADGPGDSVVLTPFVLGDMNCDEAVNLLDIEGFLLGLFDPAAYEARYPGCFAESAGDLNQDAVFDASDIEPFIEVLFR